MIELYPKGFAGFRRFKELMNVEIDIEDAPDAIPAPAFEGRVEYKKCWFLDTKKIRRCWNIST